VNHSPISCANKIKRFFRILAVSWTMPAINIIEEGFEAYDKIGQLKMTAPDGKMQITG
jgi:hypothetical protein